MLYAYILTYLFVLLAKKYLWGEAIVNKEKIKRNESGMVIVEATIVFPVMFLAIFFMIFMGNAYLQKARIESLVNRMAVEGAARCVDPMLTTIEEKGEVPKFGDYHSKPYRYLIGNMDNVVTDIESDTKKELKKLSSGLFSGMKPIFTDTDLNVNYNSNFIYSTFSIDLDYKIQMPVRLLGERDNYMIHFSAYNELPVTDSPDFIQNTDFVEDLLERAGFMDSINDVLNKVTEWTKKYKDAGTD